MASPVVEEETPVLQRPWHLDRRVQIELVSRCRYGNGGLYITLDNLAAIADVGAPGRSRVCRKHLARSFPGCSRVGKADIETILKWMGLQSPDTAEFLRLLELQRNAVRKQVGAGGGDIIDLVSDDECSIPAPTPRMLEGQETPRVRKLLDTVRRLKAKLHARTVQLGRARKRIRALHARVPAEKQLLEVERVGKKRLTRQSCIALGIRRNLTNCASKDFGRCLLEDLSGQSVCRYEVLAASSLIAATRRAAALLPDRLASRSPSANRLAELGEGGQGTPVGPAVVAVSFRGDATNSAIWRKRKLSTLVVEGLVVEEDGAVALDMSVLTDTQVVLHGTSSGFLGMVAKQMRSVGIPIWSDAVHLWHERCGEHAPRMRGVVESLVAQQTAVELNVVPIPSVVAYCATSDCGPDVAKARRSIHTECAFALPVLFLDCNCLMHQAHLITKSGLKVLDECLRASPVGLGFVGYYATLCKVVHLWRDSADKVFRAATELHGARWALEHARTPPCKPIAGRWLSVDAAEEKCHRAGTVALTAVLLPTFLKKRGTVRGETDAMGQLGGEDGVEAIQAVDVLAVDEMEAYRHTVGKWARAGTQALEDPLFWPLSKLARLARRPVRRFLEAAQAAQGHSQCSFEAPLRLLLPSLVCGQADAYMDEFCAIIADTSGEVAAIMAACSQDADVQEFMQSTSILLRLHTAASFHRRVWEPLHRWPWLFFVFLGRPYGQVCAKRQELARQLMEVPLADLEVNAVKIRLMCHDHIQVSRMTGRCTPWFWRFLCVLAQTLKPDVQLNESFNSGIKLQAERNPNISLELLSSRLSLKHALGGTFRQTASARRDWRKKISMVFQQCCQAEPSEATAIMHDTDRWAAPPAPDSVPTDTMIRNTLRETRPWARPTDLSLWAARNSLLLHRQSKTASVKKAWIIGGLEGNPHGRRAWLVVDKQNSLSVLASATVATDMFGMPYTIELIAPTVLDISTNAFVQLWHQLPEGELVLTQHTLDWCCGNGRYARLGEATISSMRVSGKMPRPACVMFCL